MSEVLTIEDIYSRYTNQWVLIGDPVTNDSLEVLSGRVLFASPDRDEVYRTAVGLRPARFAIEYTGQMSPDVAVVL